MPPIPICLSMTNPTGAGSGLRSPPNTPTVSVDGLLPTAAGTTVASVAPSFDSTGTEMVTFDSPMTCALDSPTGPIGG